MATPTLAQLEHLAQHLTIQFNTVNHLISKAWLELEQARGNLSALQITYEEWKDSKALNEE